MERILSYAFAYRKSAHGMRGWVTMWVRIFGHGLHITTSRPLFSERYGYTKPLRVFGVKFEYLPPNGEIRG